MIPINESNITKLALTSEDNAIKVISIDEHRAIIGAGGGNGKGDKINVINTINLGPITLNLDLKRVSAKI